MNQEKTEKLLSVSIIVPVYKVEGYLSKCLESLISQSYKNIEIILVDDGSPDDSLLICNQYAVRDSRIQIISQKNLGVAEARMNGFRHSQGDLIMFVDADDYVSPNIVEMMLSALQKYQVDMVSCQYYLVNDSKIENASIRPKIGYYDRKHIKNLLTTNFLYDKNTGIAGMSGYLCGRIFKRNFVQDSLAMGQGLIHSEDQIGLFKMLLSIDSMYIMEEPLYYYVIRQGQATRSYNVAYWKNFEHFFLRIKEIDRDNYLYDQIPYRVVGIVNELIIKEFTNDSLSFYQQYQSLKRNFSDTFCLLEQSADLSQMNIKRKIEYWLQVHHAFFIYGIVIYVYGFIKRKG